MATGSKRGSSAAQADAFTGSEREEKASAHSGRNDRFALWIQERVGGDECEIGGWGERRRSGDVKSPLQTRGRSGDVGSPLQTRRRCCSGSDRVRGDVHDDTGGWSERRRSDWR